MLPRQCRLYYMGHFWHTMKCRVAGRLALSTFRRPVFIPYLLAAGAPLLKMEAYMPSLEPARPSGIDEVIYKKSI
jgi:hypothetical protein